MTTTKQSSHTRRNNTHTRPRVTINDNDNDKSISDGIRYTTRELSIEDFLSKPEPIDKRPRDIIDNGLNYPYTPEEVAIHFKVDFIRSPFNETIIIENAHYEGIMHIQNHKYGNTYYAYIWTADFIQSNGIEFEIPIRGILEIKVKRWRRAGLSHPFKAFEGKCTLVADSKRQIIELKRNI